MNSKISNTLRKRTGEARFAGARGSAAILGRVPAKKGANYEEELSSREQTEAMQAAGDVSSLTLIKAAMAAPEASPPNSKVSDGGPAASDCNRDAIPPFAAPSC